MTTIVLALLAIFVATNVLTELDAEGEYRSDGKGPTHWYREALSHYFAGYRLSWLQCWGYLGLALAEALLAWGWPYGGWWIVCMLASAGGTVGVTATGIELHAKDWVDRAHIACAALAFVGAFAGIAVAMWGTAGMVPVWGAVGTSFLFWRFAPKWDALEEKAVTAWAIAGLLAVIL